MISRRTALALMSVVLAIAVGARFLRSTTKAPTPEAGNDPTNVTIDRFPLPMRPVFPRTSLSKTPAEIELDRLESDFYREFPLALKFRDYKDSEVRSAESEALIERMKAYTDEFNDVRTKNLRNGNVNIILELEAPLLIKEMLVTDSDLGQMLRVAFKAPQWDWAHMLRNLDDRIGNSAPVPPVAETVEQLLEAIEEREQHILAYSSRMQEEALMPDFIRDDIRQLARQMLTGRVTKAYLETISPSDLIEARRQVAEEASQH